MLEIKARGAERLSKNIALVCSVESYMLSDAHLFKDVCLVPILLGEYLGYEVTIVTSQINQTLLHEAFPTVKFVHVSTDGNFEENMKLYMIEHAHEIDIAVTFGPYPSYLSILKTYKMYNPLGKIYMKLDVNRYWLSRLFLEPYFEELLNLCDLVTSECKPIQMAINETLKINVKRIPNGFYEHFPTEPVSLKDKKNIILTVGRIDSPEKQVLMAVNAFLSAEIPDWELRLVGPINEEFKANLLTLINGKTNASQVKILGPIYDKVLLEKEYRQAKIFTLTSTVECHAHVLAEAAKNGCYLICTDVDGVSDITYDGRYGKIHSTSDWEGIANTLKVVTSNESLLATTCYELQAIARSSLNWRNLIQQIALYMGENPPKIERID